MLKEALKKLNQEQMDELLLALDKEVSCIIKIDLTHFIGVNVVESTNVKIIESNGIWSYGVSK